jgi:hypothetical protein
VNFIKKFRIFWKSTGSTTSDFFAPHEFQILAATPESAWRRVGSGAANRDIDLDTATEANDRNQNPGRQTKLIQAARTGRIKKALACSARRTKIVNENQTLTDVLLVGRKICSENQGVWENWGLGGDSTAGTESGRRNWTVKQDTRPELSRAEEMGSGKDEKLRAGGGGQQQRQQASSGTIDLGFAQPTKDRDWLRD